MPHYKKMYDDKEFLYAFDLDGRETTVTIERCTGGEISGKDGRKSKKPMLAFVGKKKKLALNKTNGAIIASLYGTQTEGWSGKSITLFPTTTTFGKETVECIRVKPIVPPAPAARNGNARRGTVEDKAAAQAVIDSAESESEQADEAAEEAEQSA